VLEFFNGFDLVDVVGASMRFNGFAATFLQASFVDGRPGPNNSGPNGSALWIENTAFGSAEFTHVWTSGAQAQKRACDWIPPMPQARDLAHQPKLLYFLK
jgi:hypothetical protein